MGWRRWSDMDLMEREGGGGRRGAAAAAAAAEAEAT